MIICVLILSKSLITYQNVVPISLYLTVEIVKTAQAYFIYTDVEMYYEPLDAPCIPRSWNLADDLGQIEYIFSDKTGTLTRNIMDFKMCSINNVVYGDIDGGGIEGKFSDALLRERLSNPSDPHHESVRKFFTALAVCHSVLVSNEADSIDEIEYKASSPDEAALVKGAKDVGFTFIGRDNDTLVLNVLGKEVRYKILNVLEVHLRTHLITQFNSTRKRMSIIAKCPDGQIRVFCKGADSVIYERLSEGQEDRSKILTNHMDDFGEEGLRTLCISSVVLTSHEYEAWEAEYQAAAVSLVDREEMIDAVSEKIEQDLNLLGATAIEDKLQEDVAGAIQTLRNAGIKVWVLTGDKVETAVNIGFSCNLLARDMRLIVLKAPQQSSSENYGDTDDFTVREQMEIAFEKFWHMKLKYSEKTKNLELEDIPGSNKLPESNVKHALIIDGGTLKHAMETPEDAHLFWMLSTRCDVVLCCRVSPLQKAQVVDLVKTTGHGAMCLAIGDGANDVGMIQAAQIGVGISGEEGLQAVMASDYAIGQFKFLTTLLLVHGHWSYVRTSEMILAFFFKNIIYV
jgi:phospholipid-translocating ATPase